MATETMAALVRPLETGAGTGACEGAEQAVLAPAVGLFRGQLPRGAGVVSGQVVGTLRILGRIYDLVAPEGARGYVLRCSLEPGLHPVEFGQELFQLGAAAAMGGVAEDEEKAQSAGLSATQIAVRSPTEGVFYRRPDPQSPAYVEVGSVVEAGNPLGLVEVMKCFNQVRYGGAGMPARARVVSIPVEDSAEIHYDQVLFVLEPEG